MNLKMNRNNWPALCIAICLFAPLSSYALFCPTNFNTIDFGDSTKQVLDQCGKPDKQETKEDEGNVPQEWSYYIPQTVSDNSSQQAQGTLKTSVTFDDTGKAVNISVNGLGVGASTICGNRPIQLGDTRDAVQAACGKPSFVNKQSQDASNQQQKTKITEYTYNTTPPTKLIFKDDKLTDRQ